MRLPIVDKDDEIIAVKDLNKVNHSTDIYRVSALWITNSNDEALLAKRASTKSDQPNKWGPAVAGTIEDGEDYDSNIHKEAEEEIGLTDVQFSKGPKLLRKGPRTFFCQWYFVVVDRDIDSFVIQADEVDALKWIGIGQLKEELAADPDKYIYSMRQTIDELGF